jgi:hypothetical protein
MNLIRNVSGVSRGTIVMCPGFHGGQCPERYSRHVFTSPDPSRPEVQLCTCSTPEVPSSDVRHWGCHHISPIPQVQGPRPVTGPGPHLITMSTEVLELSTTVSGLC